MKNCMSKELAWAAGLFDGEGCIHIGCVPKSKGRLSPSYRCMIKLTMGCERTVRRFGGIVGTGTFQKHKPRGKRINASFSWQAHCKKAGRILELLNPYLITKSKEAEVALKFLSLPSGTVGGAGGNKPVNRHILQRKHNLMIECAKLKPRWRFRKNKPKSTPSF